MRPRKRLPTNAPALCVTCSRPLPLHALDIRCKQCEERRKPEYYQTLLENRRKEAEEKRQRRSAGICSDCPEPIEPPSKRHCRQHRDMATERETARREARRKQGQCIACPDLDIRPLLPNSQQYCERCHIKAVLRRAKLPREWWEILRDRFHSQGERCYLCGILIALGLNAEMEHAFPQSRPEFAAMQGLGNLRWACGPCNLDKGDQSEEEYRETLRQRREQAPELFQEPPA
jgi:5-methylcytosine-specific restriction endonuclease McrA